MKYKYICLVHRALTVITYSEGCVTAPYAPPVKLLVIPYILESSPHLFYSFRGLIFRCGL